MYPALVIPLDIVGVVVPLDIPKRSLFAMETAVEIVPLSFTILVIGLIAARLLLARRQLMKVMGTYLMVSNMQ